MDRERRTGRMGFEVIRQSFMSAKRVGSEEATLRIHDFGDKNAVGVAGTSSTVLCNGISPRYNSLKSCQHDVGRGLLQDSSNSDEITNERHTL